MTPHSCQCAEYDLGDSSLEWGLFLIAAAHGEHLRTAIGPLTMTYFLLRIMGVTLFEPTLIQEHPGDAEYVERTSAFLPWPPRQKRDLGT